MGTKEDVSCISFKNGKVKTERTEAGKQKWEGRQDGMVVAWLISQKAKLGNMVTSRENQKKGLYTAFKVMKEGLSWQSRGWESACWCRGHSFNPWSRKISHAKGQLSLCAATTEPMCHNCWSPCTLEPMLHNKRSHHDAHVPQEKSPHLLQLEKTCMQQRPTTSSSSSSAQPLSHVLLFVTPWTAACQASLSQYLPEFAQVHIHWVSDAIQPSHPLSSPSPPTLNLSQHQGLLKWVSSLHQVAISIGVSASASVLPVNIQDRFPLRWTGWISLQSKGLSGVFSNATVQPQPLINNFKIKLWRN